MTAPPPPPRSRYPLALALVAIVTLGLASRAVRFFPDPLGAYPGDALWAVMAYLLLAMAAPEATPRRLAAAALAVSFTVEALQLVRWDWLVTLRGTLPGRLVLGSGFDPADLAAYTVGVGLAFGADLAWARARRAR